MCHLKEGQIRPLDQFLKLDTSSKIIAIILAKKAANALKYADTDKISPKEIQALSGLPGGTVRFTLMELRRKMLVNSEKGGYSIPNHAILNLSLNTIEGRPRKRVKQSARRNGKFKLVQPESKDLSKLLEVSQEKIGEKRLSLLLLPGKYLERSLAVLTIAREMAIDTLTPNEITRFLKEKIRTSVKRENISLALGRGTRFVDRYPDEHAGGYRYKIMVAGEKLLEEAIQKMNPKSP